MTRKILIYGDVNLNYHDGSAAWLVALARCLAQTNSHITLLLKADFQDEQPYNLFGDANISVFTPFDDRKSGFAGMKPRVAASRISVLDRRFHFDMIISRGFDIAAQLAASKRFTDRMWPYLTEGPGFQFSVSDHNRHVLDTIAQQSRRIFVQTEEARSIIESLNGTMTGKLLLMNPIVPDTAFRLTKQSQIESVDKNNEVPIRLVYAGKFARLWNTLEMTQLPSLLAEVGIESVVEMVGDKFQKTGNDDDWLAQMKAASLTKDNRVLWYGGLPRSEVFDVVEGADLGLCWRNAELDATPEISTKMLEYSALGTPPLLNRTTMHEQLLGADYPLFIDNGDIVTTIRRVVDKRQILDHARIQAFDAVKAYSLSATAERFEGYFARSEGETSTAGRLLVSGRRQRVVVAGHDFKFASDLIETLKQRADIDLRIDTWSRLAAHDINVSAKLAQWADTVICEWCGPNAVFYSQNIRPTTRLIVRFHGFEVRGKWINDLDPLKVDVFVFVSDFYRREVLRTLGWPENRTTVIYNTIDTADLDRSKLPGARFHIGLAGYVPFLKRPDRAVELLQILLHSDDRFYLHFRGRLPWQYPWEWNKPAGQDAYRAFFQSIANDSQLLAHVIFEPFSPDMGNWFRSIGWMLSPSSRETFHLAPVEGMASGAPALVWERDGASEIFGVESVRSSADKLAQFILNNISIERYEALSYKAKLWAKRYDLINVRSEWLQLLDLPKGQQPPMRGTSILPVGAEPQNQAEALVALDRALNEAGGLAAQKLIDLYPQWLSSSKSTVTAQRRFEGWADGTSLPSTSLSPLYVPDSEKIMVIGRPYEGLDSGDKVVRGKIPESIGTLDEDVLNAVDSFTRVAIRERVRAIVSSGQVGIVLAAEIAARRLGIPWFARKVLQPKNEPPFGHLIERIYQRLRTEAEQVQKTTSKRLIFNRDQVVDVQREPIRSLQDLHIGLVADQFTSQTISKAVKTTMLSRKDWARQLNGLDAVLIESAWEGKDKEWFHGVAYHGEEEAADLWGLLAACRHQNIPIIFWNKEDPVHFHSFALAASKADYVFTTDADRITDYLKQPNQNLSVASMSFYAEPKLHNPLPTTRNYSPTVSFAGTYYGTRYPKRSEELLMILESAAHEGLTIYDRQKDLSDSPYQLPEDLQQYSVGTVPYREVLQVYKAHPVNLNVNSVSDSPSMFSRRVVEIAASGSLVASGYGRGIVETLGPAFPVLTSADQWKSCLHTWLTDENARLKVAWDEMRTVLRSHRADQALTLMLRVAGLPIDNNHLPNYGLIVTRTEDLVVAAAQSLPPVIIATDESIADAARKRGLATSGNANDVQWLGYLSAEISETHYEDLLFATYFVEADVLSMREDSTPGVPLIQQGIGDKSSALWLNTINSPAEGKHPWVWRVGQGRK